jgi:flagellar hook protein FlgE
MDVSSIALQGMQQAQLQLENSARRVASANSDTVDLSQEMVSLLTAKNQFAANSNVVKIADEMQKSVINLLA